jgi:hypothetical protein
MDGNVYVKLLERWLKGAEPHLYTPPDRPDLLCYGTGENTWGVQTNQKAFAAYAMLAADPRFDERRAGVSREEVREIALKLLRYCLNTHIEGTYPLTDGASWGHTWISVLGTERMMHGVEALWAHLTEADRELLRRVMISESDWLLDHYPVVAGLYAKDGNNRPESNLWNGAFLHRTAMMYPDAPRAEQYREKGSDFLVNALSVPADAEDGAVVDGKPVAERHKGANFFPSFALNHHGYLNVGYMVICLSNAAMFHFACRQKGVAAPESLYRHVAELWTVVKACTFPDGRLLRIGGDTRVRYTYCQDYVIPAWLMMLDLQGDTDCLRFEEGWLGQIQAEMNASGDGSFLSYRCKALEQMSPLYYTRLESDRAAALSMGLAWRDLALQGAASGRPAIAPHEGERAHSRAYSPQTERSLAEAFAPVEPVPLHVPSSGAARASLESWHDPYHGAYLHRSERRIASWVWEAAEKPQGLCLPPSASDLAEWRENLAGRIEGLGRFSDQRLETHDGRLFPGGFLTWGGTVVRTHGLLAEGQPQEQEIARNRIVCAALPDGVQMIVLQHAVALQSRTFLTAVKGLHLVVPNDVFNGNRRMYYHRRGASAICGYGGKKEIVRTGSRWLNIDGRLGVIAVYGADQLSIRRPGRRNIGLKDSLKTAGLERTLYADEICGPCEVGIASVAAGRTILDAGYVLQSDVSREVTEKYAADAGHADAIAPAAPHLKAVRVRGFDGHVYVLAANFGDRDETWRLPHAGDAADVVTGESLPRSVAGHPELMLPQGGARLIRL